MERKVLLIMADKCEEGEVAEIIDIMRRASFKCDGVSIAGEYVIQSTLPISDAYHSGDRSALNDKQKETLDMASAILAEIITEAMDAYDKEVAVYSWMTKNLVHDEGLLPVIPQTQSDCDNPYGVLKYHNAVCVGYATTFRMFMQMLDIPCKVVHNSERYHSWDLVQMGDGWYHTDIYSDAGRGNFANFNLTDTMQSQRQNWNTDFFPPASRLEYCYAYRMSTEETDPYHVPAALRAALDNRDTILALRFVDNSMNETNAQIVQSMLESIRNVLYSSPYDSQLYMDWNWMAADQDWLLSVTLTWYEQGEDPDPVRTDEDYEKIANAVQEAFGDIESTEDYPYYDDSNENIVWGK